MNAKSFQLILVCGLRVISKNYGEKLIKSSKFKHQDVKLWANKRESMSNQRRGE